MGATTFTTTAKGKTAAEAFEAACRQARYDHGHAGYTGTIAEKTEFVAIPLPPGSDVNTAEAFADALIRAGDKRVDSKWGPAGCFDLGNGEFMFFGWASC